ncbi:VOC family protein [Microbacterium sp. NPDC055903]
MTQRIIPNLWFDRSAEDAGDFYASALPRASAVVTARYPDEVPEWQRDFAGQALTVDVDIDGYQVTLINAGDEFRPNASISFMLNFDPLLHGGDREAAARALDDTWAALSASGNVVLDLGEYPFSPRYGWVEDRYGVNWQLMLTDPAGDPRPFVIPQLLFAGEVQGRAREAAEFYVSLFEDSGLGFVAEYPAATGPASAGEVMFGEFRIAEQWFAMMDSAVDRDARFTCGVSLEVRCADQREIDRLWGALSAVPEAEACGWLADRHGVSWQIVPEQMAELMRRPGAYEHMMSMKKLIIADF